jgi:hypothetical protein
MAHADSEWQSEARDAETEPAQPSPAQGSGGEGRGVGAARSAVGVLRPYNPVPDAVKRRARPHGSRVARFARPS